MIRFVEYNENGEIFHVCQIDTAEGSDAPPPIIEPVTESSEPTERSASRLERKAAREARDIRIKELISEKESRTLVLLKAEASKPNKRLIILNDEDILPDSELHKVENGKIRNMTNSEKAARKATRESVQA